jgi:hypothetical protein
MDLFRTGRTRRLTLSWDFTVNGLYRELIPHGEGYTAVTGFHVGWMGFGLWAGAPNAVCGDPPTFAPPHGYLLPPSGTGPDGLVYVVQLRLPFDEWHDEYGPWGTEGSEFPVAAYKEVPQTTPQNFHVEGSATLYMDVEEWKAIDIDAQTPRVPLDYPTSGNGPPDDDFVGLSTLRYYEGPQAGGEWGFTISIDGGHGCSSSGVIPPDAAGPDLNAHRPVVKLFLRPSESEGIEAQIDSVDLSGAAVDFDLVDYEDDAFRAEGGSDGSISVWAEPTGGTHPSGPYLVTCANTPDTALAIDGLTTRLFEENYGDSVDYRRSWAAEPKITKASGVYTGQETYKDQSICVERCDSGQVTTLQAATAPKPDLFVWLDNEWMLSAGEMPQDWRIMIADDFTWAPFELRHRPASSIEDFPDLDGWSAINATLSLEGGAMRIDVSGGPGEAAKEYQEDASQYRKLRIRAKAASGLAGFRVRLNDSDLYYWDLQITDTMRDYVIDLCAPGASSASCDLTDNSYIEPGEFYGPREITHIRIEDLDDGNTYWVERIEFARTGSAVYTPLPPFDESFLGDDGVERYRLCWGLCDKRQVLDLPYRTNDGITDKFLTISDLLEEISAHDAYDVRVAEIPGPAPEAAQYYYNYDEQLAAFMATEHYRNGMRKSLDDTPLGGRRPIQWLLRFDKVEVYPDIGDPGKAHGGAYPLRFTKRLQMTAHGLVINNVKHKAQSQEGVRLKLNGLLQQFAITDAEGYYRFQPFKPGAGTWQLGTEVSGDVTLASGLTDRKYRWAGLAGLAEVVRRHSAAVSDATGRLYVAYTDEPGIICRRIDLIGATHDFLVKPDVAPPGLGIEWTRPHRLTVIFSDSGAVLSKCSSDDGATWEDDVPIFSSADYPNIQADAINGLLYAFAHDGTGIRCKRSLDGGVTWQDEVQVVSECPEQQCGVTIRPDLRNTLFVTYVDEAGVIQIASSADNGLTWT